MTLILVLYLPQATIIVILENFITQKIVHGESWLHSALTFSSSATWMAIPWY